MQSEKSDSSGRKVIPAEDAYTSDILIRIGNNTVGVISMNAVFYKQLRAVALLHVKERYQKNKRQRKIYISIILKTILFPERNLHAHTQTHTHIHMYRRIHPAI